MTDASVGQGKGFRYRLGSVLRSKKSRSTLRKGSIASQSSADTVSGPKLALPVPLPPQEPVAPLEAHRLKHREKWQQIDSQVGERRDHTELLHTIGRLDPFESEESLVAEPPDTRPPGDRIIATLSPEVWDLILSYLTPIEGANLALANRTLYIRLGRRPWVILDREEHWRQKIEFLTRFDQQLPEHLLCFACATYHLRTQVGNENLRPAHVLNPLFNCPNSKNVLRPSPRARLTPGRNLPFMFVQLVLRASRFSPQHGIPIDTLCKRWRRDGWSYHTQYYIHKGHLLMRVVSSCFAPSQLTAAGQRLLLFSRDDYSPYFSVCSHWKEGELMHVCKCALTHVPDDHGSDGLPGVEARLRNELAGRTQSAMRFASLCGNCRPMRRCPECPTEYLVEVKLTEDKSVRGRVTFRYALTVTRWSDLGDGTSPHTPQWAACNGEGPPFDSFAALQKRSISGTFESAFAGDAIPGQRILSLNPKQRTLRRPGESWY